jgi:hypothetical protein
VNAAFEKKPRSSYLGLPRDLHIGRILACIVGLTMRNQTSTFKRLK